MVKTPTPFSAPKVSKVEGIKERSNALREPVATEILQDTTHFSEDGIQILKFHGSYQQDNRDNRIKGQEKDYQFMLRTRNPGGYIPAQLYLVLDQLSEEYGNHTLRATTRQGFQLHGVLKQNLKLVLGTIIRNMGSTLGACGDLNRNVMAPPAPFKDRPEYVYAREYAHHLAELLTPHTGAYYEIWLDGEKAITAEPHPDVAAALSKNGNGTIVHDSEEPIYGTHYMPRKFKCAIAVPGDNSVDLFSQDVSLVVITDENGLLQGFNVFAGGGLGRTHNKEETFARLADPIGYVDKADVFDAVKAIVATQRDYGDRGDRRHARMKYLLHDWGVDRFRRTVEEYFGKSFEPMKPLPEFKYNDFLGWHEQGDGKLFLGISVQNGRIYDNGSLKLKTALREIEQQFALPMRVTPHQNVILYEIDPAHQADIQAILDRSGIKLENAIDPLVRYSMACPALPTCGLAITESERALPGILDRIRTLLNKMGLKNEHFVIRMTGCPNGCARPYLAELGLVGQAPDSYQVWLGADPNQTRLAEVYVNNLKGGELEAALEPLFFYFKNHRTKGESFGDFCHRVGFDALREFAATYKSVVSKNRSRYRLGVEDGLYQRLKATATTKGVPMTELVEEALEAYLKTLE
ncbi:sulfite reductase, ferredoxin dependent [Oscillatoria sp. FACHB-1407]|uniref:sulfite reductase, ferredoxin dependent n=1 Tax=Oscillatoria sp. FACHB-1407 TaxID=2692847 RepID=UPI0016883848|nr:sulfite reductase, ferredoxin dependent [Oscillatoria sp. FACHB-1407]MBD2465169.1 sulfite reductase, ferredoxin dependent [Oscillatoria sp. FACHB-1407]